jgi:hypothetical protein
MRTHPPALWTCSPITDFNFDYSGTDVDKSPLLHESFNFATMEEYFLFFPEMLLQVA